jgi:hypothetical protein
MNKILFPDIERLLQMQYNSKLYPELLKVKKNRKFIILEIFFDYRI